MDSVNTKLLEDQSSRRKRKATIIISLIILFTIIIGSIISVFTILKHKAESELLSNANPNKAIRAVCFLTPYRSSCFRSIRTPQSQSNQASSHVSPSEIFALSLHASFSELTILNSEPQRVLSKVNASSRILSSLKECESLISDSLKLINKSMTTVGTVPDDKIFKETESLSNLIRWISNARGNLDRCKNGLEDDQEAAISNAIGKFYLARMKLKTLMTRNYVENSLSILGNMNGIMDMFYHPVQRILPDFLLSGRGFNFGIVFYGLQYILLVFLFCLLLRLY